MKHKGGIAFRLFAALCVVGLALGFAPAASAAAAGASDADTCKGCHEAYVTSFEKSTHGRKGHPNSPAVAGGCASCHGDASAHIKAGGGKGTIKNPASKKMPAAEKEAACMSCHQGNRHLAFWSAGAHRKNDVACNDCHSLHGTPGRGATMALVRPNPSITPYQTTERQLAYETCTTCHKQIRSQLLKPSHHPIIEGRMTCGDCHNPHGALSPAMVKSESVVTLCQSCHAEKRGPFIWNHPPVEENCLVCHSSHGSNHARLLTEKGPNVCQDCHDAAKHPGTVYDAKGGWITVPPGGNPSTRLIARGCVNCHYFVHGSNAPAMRGKFFLR